MTVSAASSAPRMHFVDGLRAFAMFAVLLCHSYLYAGINTLVVHFGAHAVNAASLFGFGNVGVNVFLLLSGFCLYWPFVKRGSRPEPNLAEYLFRRCRRILPPYYAALGLFGAIGLLQVVTHHHIYHRNLTFHYLGLWLLWHALMAHNLSVSQVVAIDAPLWSLALEFQLYILFPILVEAYRRWNKRGVLVLVLALSSVYRAAIPASAIEVDPLNLFVLYYSVFGRCFEFALGMYVADILSRWPQGENCPLSAVDYLLGAALVAAGIWHGPLFADAAWGIPSAALILVGSREPGILGWTLSRPLFVRVGIFSYSVYLIHQPFIIFVGGMLAAYPLPKAVHWVLVLGVLLPVLICVGYGYHLLFEKPFMTSRRKPAATGAAVESPSGDVIVRQSTVDVSPDPQ